MKVIKDNLDIIWITGNKPFKYFYLYTDISWDTNYTSGNFLIIAPSSKTYSFLIRYFISHGVGLVSGQDYFENYLLEYMEPERSRLTGFFSKSDFFQINVPEEINFIDILEGLSNLGYKTNYTNVRDGIRRTIIK